MSFNWRLLLAPAEILDYVVEHEVAHLEVHDHSERFWSLLGSRCPGLPRARGLAAPPRADPAAVGDPGGCRPPRSPGLGRGGFGAIVPPKGRHTTPTRDGPPCRRSAGSLGDIPDCGGAARRHSRSASTIADRRHDGHARPPEPNRPEGESQREQQPDPGGRRRPRAARSPPRTSRQPRSRSRPRRPPVRRLFRSRTDRVLGGVCGGIGRYFGVDPILVRIVAVVGLLLGGATLVAYIAAMILVPCEPRRARPRRHRGARRRAAGPPARWRWS